MVITVQQLYDYAFKHCLLHENVNSVLKYYKSSVPEDKDKKECSYGNNVGNILTSGTIKTNLSKFDTLIEFTYEDVLELFNLPSKY